MSILRIIRVLTRLSLERIPQSEVLQFGGTEVSAPELLADEFEISSLPLVSQLVNVRVLLKSFSHFRFSRWDYYRTYIQLANARVILVWHDTNIEAYALSRFIDIPVFVIQNGVRHNVGPASGCGFIDDLRRLSERSRPMVDVYFCFGAAEPILLGDYITTRFVQHGSLRANAYAARRTTLPHRPTGKSVGFIVSFPNKNEVPTEHIQGNGHPFTRIGQKVISYAEYFALDAVTARALARVSTELGANFQIIGKRSDERSIEADFFREVLGDHADVLCHEKGDGYATADRFDYLVTVDSTLGYEMRALGKNVAFVSNRLKLLGISSGDLTYGYPLNVAADGEYWTSATSEPEIEDFLRRWILRCESNMGGRPEDSFHLMHLDPRNSILRTTIREQIANRQ